jgi:hypothetical protein
MRCRVVLERTDVSEERVASIIKVKRISERGTTLPVTSNCSTSVLTRATWRQIAEDGILHSASSFYNSLRVLINQQTLWPLVSKRTIPTDRPPLVGEIKFQLLRLEGCRVVSAADPTLPLITVF